MNQYDTNLTQVVKRVAGHVIRVAADDSFPPWVVKRSMLGGQKEPWQSIGRKKAPERY